jgi:hypothetical protein
MLVLILEEKLSCIAFLISLSCLCMCSASSLTVILSFPQVIHRFIIIGGRLLELYYFPLMVPSLPD